VLYRMRQQVPREPRTPRDALKYLLPMEVLHATIRQHPAVLTMPLAAALGGLLAAIAGSLVPHVAGSVRLVVWMLTAFLFARLVLALLNWMAYCVVLTKERLLVVSGVFNQRVVVIRLVDLENMTYERSSTGRITGHGSLIIGPGGSPQTVIEYIAYPEELYLQVREIVGRRELAMSEEEE
jgi:uncharacterized membrane protein YdbT with pleckstrin-like domain